MKNQLVKYNKQASLAREAAHAVSRPDPSNSVGESSPFQPRVQVEIPEVGSSVQEENARIMVLERRPFGTGRGIDLCEGRKAIDA